MIESTDLSGKLALDSNGLSRLKTAARDNSPEAIKAVAKQFEGIFMNMMLKSMREASPQDGEFDSEQTRSFTAMLDQQLTQNLSSKGLGLAEVLARQLSSQSAASTQPRTPSISEESDKKEPANQSAISNKVIGKAIVSDASNSLINNPLDNVLQTTLATKEIKKVAGDHVDMFQQKMAEHANNVSQTSGFPSHFPKPLGPSLD